MRVGIQRHAPAALLPGKRPDNHYTGSWMGLWVIMDRYGKSGRHRGSNTRPSSP